MQRSTSLEQSSAAPTILADLPGSRRAWVVAWAAFVVGFVVFGAVYSFGVFLRPMAADFQSSQAATTVLFAATGIAFYLIGPVTGHLGDRLGPRVMIVAGAALMGAGLILTAFVTRLWAAWLTYGTSVGLGAACAYLPALAIVGGWFERKRGTALGIAAAGTGAGTMVVPPVASTLIEQFGWRSTVIILGLGCMLLLAGSAACVRRPPLTVGGNSEPLGRAVFSFAFMTMYLSWVLSTMALFVAFVFLPASAMRLGADQTSASGLLSIIGGMSILGRVGIGIVSERAGITGLFKAAVLVMGVSYGLWLSVTAYSGLVAFAVVLGLGYGVRIALVPAVLIGLFGLQRLGTLLGAFFTATGVASILGPLLAGVVIDATGSYQWGIAFACLLGAAGFAAILPLRTRAEA